MLEKTLPHTIPASDHISESCYAEKNHQNDSHCYYPYNALRNIEHYSTSNTKKLFKTVTRAIRTNLSNSLVKIPQDYANNHSLTEKLDSAALIHNRNAIHTHLVKFSSVNTQSYEKKENILEQKGLGERYTPDIPYDYNRPMILIKSTNRGKSAWWYVHCNSRKDADTLGELMKSDNKEQITLTDYGDVVARNFGKKPPLKYPEGYGWNKTYFQTLLDCETYLAKGASLEWGDQHIIELAAENNHTELFYYLLIQTWDKAGYTKTLNVENTQAIDPKLLPRPLKKALSFSLFWATHYNNPIIADIALHYGADPGYPSRFSKISPIELTLTYHNQNILDIMAARNTNAKRLLLEADPSTLPTHIVDRYYQEKASNIIKNKQISKRKEKNDFPLLLQKFKKENMLYSDIETHLVDKMLMSHQRFESTRKPPTIQRSSTHYYYPYSAEYELPRTSQKNTRKLFQTVGKAERTKLNDYYLFETRYDRAINREISGKFDRSLISHLGDYIHRHLVHFSSIHMYQKKKGEYFWATELDEHYDINAPHKIKNPIILVQHVGKKNTTWQYIECTNNNSADSLKQLIASGRNKTMQFKQYGRTIAEGSNKNHLMQHPSYYEWDAKYIRTLYNCETYLAHGAGFEKNGQHIIELAAKKNHTELFYYLLMQTWDKAKYGKMGNPNNITKINPKSLPRPLRKALSMSLFWAIQYGNPVIAEIALHYGANANRPSTFASISPIELAIYYQNTDILDVLKKRDTALEHRIAIAQCDARYFTPTIDSYYQRKVAYVTENIESDPLQKRTTFLLLFKRLKKNNLLHSEIQEHLAHILTDKSLVEYNEFTNESITTIPYHIRRKLQSGQKFEIMMPEELLKVAKFSNAEYLQIIKELTILVLLKQKYCVSLSRTEENELIKVALSTSLRDTLAGQILMDADYLMKACMHYPSSYIPLEYQENALSEYQEKVLKNVKIHTPEQYICSKFGLQLFKENNAIILSEDKELYNFAFKTQEYNTTVEGEVIKEIIAEQAEANLQLQFKGSRCMFSDHESSLSIGENFIISNAYSYADEYYDFNDKEEASYSQSNPSKKSIMPEFNQLIRTHPLLKQKFARLDITYKLYNIVRAYVESGQTPDLPKFKEKPINTPLLLPPILSYCMPELCSYKCSKVFGGVEAGIDITYKESTYKSISGDPWIQSSFPSTRYPNNKPVTLEEVGYQGTAHVTSKQFIHKNSLDYTGISSHYSIASIRAMQEMENTPFNPNGSVGAAQPWTQTAKIKKLGLPREGRVRFIPGKDWNPTDPKRGDGGIGYKDKFENIWIRGKAHMHQVGTEKEVKYEWDVQLSDRGMEMFGWAAGKGKRYINVSHDGKITHR